MLFVNTLTHNVCNNAKLLTGGKSTKNGFPVLLDRFGTINVKGLMEACNYNDELLIRYYLLIWEYMFGHDEYSYEESWTKMYTIEDVGGVKMWHITRHVVSFLKKLTSCTKVKK